MSDDWNDLEFDDGFRPIKYNYFEGDNSIQKTLVHFGFSPRPSYTLGLDDRADVDNEDYHQFGVSACPNRCANKDISCKECFDYSEFVEVDLI